MDDLISRQAAIDAVFAWYEDCKINGINVKKPLVDWLKGLPSAQPERKRGKWMDMGDYCVCNQCWHTEQQFNGVEQIPLHTPFCAMCGADMREEKTDD